MVQTGQDPSIKEIIDRDGERFPVLSILGEGGMSVVYKVWQPSLNREVALKLLKDTKGQSATQRLLLEAKAIAKLEHPNIIKIFAVGLTVNSEPFLLLEYFPSESLKAKLEREKTLDENTVVILFEQVLRALETAHAQGFIHRDLTPANVLIGANSEVKIADFGIAKSLEPSAGQQAITATGQLVGSPICMSPEQCRGEIVDARSDLYAVGCMLYQALTGEPPFTANSSIEVMYKHLFCEPPLLPNNFKANYRRLIQKSLSKDRVDRYASAEEMKADLREQYTTSELGLSQADHDRNKKKKHIQTSWPNLAVIVLLASATAFFFFFSIKTTKTSKPQDDVAKMSLPEATARAEKLYAEACRGGSKDHMSQVELAEKSGQIALAALNTPAFTNRDQSESKQNQLSRDADLARLHFILGRQGIDRGGMVDQVSVHLDQAMELGANSLPPAEYKRILHLVEVFYRDAPRASLPMSEIASNRAAIQSLATSRRDAEIAKKRLIAMRRFAYLMAKEHDPQALRMCKLADSAADINHVRDDANSLMTQLLLAEIYLSQRNFKEVGSIVRECEMKSSSFAPADALNARFRICRAKMLLARALKSPTKEKLEFQEALDAASALPNGTSVTCLLLLDRSSWLNNEKNPDALQLAIKAVNQAAKVPVETKTLAEAKALLDQASSKKNDRRFAADRINDLCNLLQSKVGWGDVELPTLNEPH